MPVRKWSWEPSYLTDIITCQIRKQNPGQTLSDFGVNFHVVLPTRSGKLRINNRCEHLVYLVRDSVVSSHARLCQALRPVTSCHSCPSVLDKVQSVEHSSTAFLARFPPKEVIP